MIFLKGLVKFIIFVDFENVYFFHMAPRLDEWELTLDSVSNEGKKIHIIQIEFFNFLRATATVSSFLAQCRVCELSVKLVNSALSLLTQCQAC